jgi:hypothetical protein
VDFAVFSSKWRELHYPDKFYFDLYIKFNFPSNWRTFEAEYEWVYKLDEKEKIKLIF